MSFQISAPSNFLSPYVKQYWAIENCIQPGESHIQRIVPTGLVELFFYFGNKPKAVNKNRRLLDNTLISGQQKEHYDIVVTGNLSTFSVTLLPQGAMMFFDLPLIELYDQTIPLQYLQKDAIDKVESDLFESKTFSEKVFVIENFLAQKFLKNYREYDAARINGSIRLINQTNGIVSINTLASRACLSRKQYERIFGDSVGISPKRFLRIIRFQNAIFRKQLNSKIRLTDLAYDCGYYDQSHMINDFKYLSGMTPKQYFSDCEPYSDYFK
ncbi:MAG: AraC family transcriptional regulator [Bacteroidales bacterium]|nr:AraC family transcriptional regulator [Bacteroidales bacterium]